MAKVKVADVIVPEVFNSYVIERTAEKSALYQSGIIQPVEGLNALAAAGGRIINMPFWEDLDGDDQLLKDDEALNVNKISAKKDMAALLARGNAWSANDLAKALSGDDPMAAIGDLVADYWARRWQKVLINILNGLYDGGGSTQGMDSNFADITGETGDAAVIGSETAIDAIYKMGDAYEKLTAVAMHSGTMAKLAKDDLIDYVKPSEGSPDVPVFLNKQVIVDDGLPKDGDDYTTFFFGAGAIGYGEGGAPVPTETDRDSLAGDDILINRRHFVLHPRGVKWTDDTCSEETPDNDELAMAANWERVYEAKNVRIVGFKHKLSN